MSNEPKDPQSKPSATPVARPEVGHVEEHGLQPVAYVPPPAKPPTGDGGAEMVSE
jgi:hypothetical protein